jgi:hypothetical protein
MQVAASYRRKIGVVDASGKRHTISSYVALTPGDVAQLALATYITGAVGIGVRLPASAESQFDGGHVWDVVPGDYIEGGHYVVCCGRNSKGLLVFITWGRFQAATDAWVKRYMDEGIAYISPEILSAKGLSPEGYNASQLASDLVTATSKPMEATMTDPVALQGQAIDPGELDAAQVAVRAAVNTFTYDGFNVGTRVTDDQCRQVAVAAVAAVEQYRSAKSL